MTLKSGVIRTDGSGVILKIVNNMSDMGGALVSGIIGLAKSAVDNKHAAEQASLARRENYRFGEMAADEADKRTRALYSDLYSPQALMKQYQEAGLSPSLMFGGAPGQGGTTGAQGTGAAGPGTPFVPMSLLEAAQAANLAAQTQKTKAETQNIKEDTKIKALQEEWQTMMNNEKSIDFELSTLTVNYDDGSAKSMFEVAENCYDYDKFLEEVRRLARNTSDIDSQRIIMMMGTEAGQKTMRQIYMNANRFERDIKVLSQEGVSAEFQQEIMKCLQQKDFAKQNAETAIKQMKAAGEAADLTTEQKGAWNNIIERLQKTNSTAADIIIVASMILNQAASHWNSNVWGTTK